ERGTLGTADVLEEIAIDLCLQRMVIHQSWPFRATGSVGCGRPPHGSTLTANFFASNSSGTRRINSRVLLPLSAATAFVFRGKIKHIFSPVSRVPWPCGACRSLARRERG